MMRMKKWTWPQNYGGARWDGYYVFMAQTRDSDAFGRSNFRCALAEIGGETGEDENGIEAVVVVRESHWVCGWVEWIAIHESAAEQIAKAENILECLEGYLIVNENDFSEEEDKECAEVWENCYTWRERAAYLRQHSHGVTPWRDLLAAVRGSWYHAANMLHCPSDLIY